MRSNEFVIETKRASAAVKLQRAWEREQAKSTASRQRADQAKAEFDKQWKEKKEKEQGVAEGDSGTKYKVKSIGYDSKGDYYISPSTGKKVYKKAKVGDHENPNSGEHKPKVRMPYKEDGSSGGTSSGSIASVAMPLGGKKKKKGGAVNLLGGPVFKR